MPSFRVPTGMSCWPFAFRKVCLSVAKKTQQQNLPSLCLLSHYLPHSLGALQYLRQITISSCIYTIISNKYPYIPNQTPKTQHVG